MSHCCAHKTLLNDRSSRQKVYFLGCSKAKRGGSGNYSYYAGHTCPTYFSQAKVVDTTSREEGLGDKVDKWKHFGFLT